MLGVLDMTVITVVFLNDFHQGGITSAAGADPAEEVGECWVY